MALPTYKKGLEFSTQINSGLAAMPAIRSNYLPWIIRKLLRSTIFFSVNFDQPVGNASPEVTREGEEPLVRNILLVDDAEDNRLLIQLFLRKTEYQVEIAENGEIAVELFKKGHFELVLMDMHMPVMDGYSATKLIRQWEAEQGLQNIPILALTAYALKEDIQKALDAGCTAYLTKPVKKAILLETLSRYTNGKM